MNDQFEKLKQIVDVVRQVPCCRPVSVGGSVRDALILNLDLKQIEASLMETGKDYDLEIFGMKKDNLLICLANAGIKVELVGRAFPVYKVSGYNIDISFPRIEYKTGSAHTDFNFEINPTMSFSEAALRRDLTINAIGYDWALTTLVDPFHGIQDIKDKTLRHVSSQFNEDALRVLRVFKFIARLGFQPSNELLALCPLLRTELKSYARERILPEWNDFILKGRAENVDAALGFLSRIEVLRDYPELADLEHTVQDAHHHPEGSVMRHTCHCLQYFMAKIRDTLATDYEKLVVGYAVLTHDMGKSECTKITSEGKISAHGHEDSALPRRFLERLFDPAEQIIKDVEVLVKAHMRPVLLYKGGNNLSATRRLNVAVNGRIDLLLKVVECDQGGRPPKPVDWGAINWVKGRLSELNLDTSSVIKPLVMGRHLITELKLEPGPHFSPILDDCFQAQLDGVFVDVEGGLTYLAEKHKNRKE